MITHRFMKCQLREPSLEVTIEFDSGWEASGTIFLDSKEHVDKELKKMSRALKHHDALVKALKEALDWLEAEEGTDDLHRLQHLRSVLKDASHA